MFDIYLQTIQTLGYPQDFDSTDDLWDSSIDELSALIAQTDSEKDPLGFFAECDRINETLESLGFQI
jgi:hypothetical protein